MVHPSADGQVRVAVHKGLHRAAVRPGAYAPPGVVRVGERVRAEVALRLLRLLDRGDGVGEELVQERRVLQPEPGHDDNGHTTSPRSRAKAPAGPAVRQDPLSMPDAE